MSAAVSTDGRARLGVRSDLVAGRLALAGASLGLLAGLVELAAGPSVREWVGGKLDTTRLGLTTITLSAVALAAAIALRRPHERTGGRRVAIVLALLLPGLVCFTTVGRLWYLPGVLLVAAGGLVLAGTPRREFAGAFDERHWRIGLLVACGAYYVVLGATALGVAGLLGMLGGTLIWAAAYVASRSARGAYALLLAGALPFATATWWSAITPLIAVLTLIIGSSVIRHANPVAAPVRQRARGASPRA